MVSKKSGSKAKSGGGAKAGKRTAKKASLKDLDAKRSQMIRGGKVLDKTSPLMVDH